MGILVYGSSGRLAQGEHVKSKESKGTLAPGEHVKSKESKGTSVQGKRMFKVKVRVQVMSR